MAYSASQLQTLEDAYAAGLLEVMFQGRREVFASGKDLAERIALIKLELAAATPTIPPPVRTVRIYQDDEL